MCDCGNGVRLGCMAAEEEEEGARVCDWDGSIGEEVEGARVRDCQLLSPSEHVNHS